MIPLIPIDIRENEEMASWHLGRRERRLAVLHGTPETVGWEKVYAYIMIYALIYTIIARRYISIIYIKINFSICLWHDIACM